ncbi:protein white-like [Branchiostoma floridae x Branchiostoma japonicum]
MEDPTERTALLSGSPKPAANGSLSPVRNGSPARPVGRGSPVPVAVGDRDRITLRWADIHVSAPGRGGGCCRREKPGDSEPIHILRGVSGTVEPGTLLAIMGASGAGKSTLLNVLTYRNRGNLTVEGTVEVNGQQIGKNITSVSAYVQQDDLFIGVLTVREHLRFQARLRMDKHIPHDVRMARVEEVIMQMGLSKCADTKIGTPGRKKGISGGEMKRLAFASEVLTNPPLMFCDEPTSGLDSFMAESVVNTLQGVAQQGRTIMCTIHQPSSEVYALFDKVLIMAEGRVAYMGPTSEVINFFGSVGFTCPPAFNPADFFIQTLAIRPGKEERSRDRVEKICDQFQEVRENKDAKKQLAANHADQEFVEDYSGRSRYRATWIQQFLAMMWRCNLQNIRDPMIMGVRTGQAIFVALLVGIVYLRIEYNQDGILNINGALFLMLTNIAFSHIFSVINVFPAELPIFRREHGNGMYRTDVYFLCKTIAELPYFVVLPLVFTAICYWMVGLYEGWQEFLICFAIITITANVSVSAGYMISTLSPSVDVAMAIAAPMLIPLMLFGGFFLKANSVPVYFIWLEYVSWFKYANELLCINQWSPVTNITCTEGIPFCLETGEQVLQNLSYDEDNFYVDLYALLALMVGFRLLSFIFLLIRSWKD